ncbi:hypothetical protein K438DRAFT_1770458 [Mycena galopus ATCC 62051]|nr:hypothetical protein K438DRAFT_1770458 [Mycena galopus ATCC 62051]
MCPYLHHRPRSDDFPALTPPGPAARLLQVGSGIRDAGITCLTRHWFCVDAGITSVNSTVSHAQPSASHRDSLIVFQSPSGVSHSSFSQTLSPHFCRGPWRCCEHDKELVRSRQKKAALVHHVLHFPGFATAVKSSLSPETHKKKVLEASRGLCTLTKILQDLVPLKEGLHPVCQEAHGGQRLDDKLFAFWHLQDDAHLFTHIKGICRFETGIKVTEFRDLRTNPHCLLESHVLGLRASSMQSWVRQACLPARSTPQRPARTSRRRHGPTPSKAMMLLARPTPTHPQQGYDAASAAAAASNTPSSIPVHALPSVYRPPLWGSGSRLIPTPYDAAPLPTRILQSYDAASPAAAASNVPSSIPMHALPLAYRPAPPTSAGLGLPFDPYDAAPLPTRILMRAQQRASLARPFHPPMPSSHLALPTRTHPQQGYDAASAAAAASNVLSSTPCTRCPRPAHKDPREGAVANFPSLVNLVCNVFNAPVFAPETQIANTGVLVPGGTVEVGASKDGRGGGEGRKMTLGAPATGCALHVTLGEVAFLGVPKVKSWWFCFFLL